MQNFEVAIKIQSTMKQLLAKGLITDEVSEAIDVSKQRVSDIFIKTSVS